MTIAGSVFFPVVINTAAGVINIDSIYLDVAKNYGAGKLNFFFKIALPGAMPVMLEGIQMGQAIALLTIVAAEMMGATSGIGYLIWTSYKAFLLQEMYVGLILISFFGYLFSLVAYGESRKSCYRGGEQMSKKAKITIRNLTKAFYKKQGSVTALDDISI